MLRQIMPDRPDRRLPHLLWDSVVSATARARCGLHAVLLPTGRDVLYYGRRAFQSTPVHMRAYSLTPSQRYFHSHRIPDSSHPLGFSWKIWVWMAEVFAFKMLA